MAEETILTGEGEQASQNSQNKAGGESAAGEQQTRDVPGGALKYGEDAGAGSADDRNREGDQTRSGDASGGEKAGEKAGGKEGEAEGKDEDGKGEKGGEEDQTLELKMPDGVTVEPDTELLGSFTEWAKEQGLGQEAAQKMLDGYAQRAQAIHDQAIRQRDEQMDAWAKQVKEHPQLGADLNATAEHARRGLNGLVESDPALKEGFDDLSDRLSATGLGNHPILVRAFSLLGEQVFSEDKGHHGGGGGNVGPNVEDPLGQKASVLYPNS